MNHPQAQTIRIIFVVATGTAALIASGLYYYFYFLKKGKTQPQLTQKTGSTEIIINKETSSPLFNKSEPVNYPPPHRGLLNDRDPVMVIERKSVGSRRKNEELFAEELYTAGRKKDSYPEGKLSPKESRDPSKVSNLKIGALLHIVISWLMLNPRRKSTIIHLKSMN